MADVINTTNKFFVASRGDNLLFMKPPLGEFSKEDALNMAAYLVVMSFTSDEDFLKHLRAVENT